MSWKPPPRKEWKGRINSYLIEATRLDNGLSKRNQPAHTEIFVSPQSNHPDPSLATEPIQYESYFINDLEENFEYTFTISIINTAGKGISSNPKIQKMPQSGTENYCVLSYNFFSTIWSSCEHHGS